jgi:hypothetical protein
MIQYNNKFFDVILEQNSALGQYHVGDQVYFSKVQALIEGTRTGQFPTWNFNNEVFGKQEWTLEPESTLRELYRLRAQQLRDKYDYIRIECSGGGDSAQVVFNFLLNNIHVDEILFRYPKAGEKNIPVDPSNFRVENHLSEYELATKPLLNWIQTNYPKTKITIHDYSEDMLADEDRDESWVYAARDFLQPAHVTKFTTYHTMDQRLLVDQGKKICILYGIDKPKICHKDNKWYLYFIDFQANYANPDVAEYTNITNEYFFWTPDFPEILIKQAHIIVNWFNHPANRHLQFLARWPNHSNIQRTAYEGCIKPLIYLDYDPTTFQVAKPSTNFYSEMDYWFYENFKDHKLYSSWKAGIGFVERNIDSKYFNKEFSRKTGFVGFLSPFYYIGDVTANTNQTIKIADNNFDRF